MTPPHPQDLLDFSGHVVIVTGSGSGLGSGIATRFAAAGATLVVNYRTSHLEAQQVVETIHGQGGTAAAIQADVTKKEEVDRLLAQTVDLYGTVNTWVNNAGIYPLSPLIDMTKAEWDAVIETNLSSVFLSVQAVAKQMIVQKTGGSIINIASIEGENPAPMHSHYNAAKGGVLMHTQAAAHELGPHGIRVNAVSPGLIWRAGLDEAWPEGVQRWQKAAPLTRLGQPDDVADACLFLASPAARWITGINLRVDGGVMTHQIF